MVSYLPCTVICGWSPERYHIARRALMYSYHRQIEPASVKFLLKKKDWSNEEEMVKDLRM